MIRSATLDDLDQLVRLEQSCFTGDRLSRRSFRHLIRRGRALLLVATASDGSLGGYVVVLFRKGTSLARLYSIAVAPDQRGQGIGAALASAAEAGALDAGCAVMRLEIRRDNAASLALFLARGYREFGVYPGYYEDAMEALRLERRLPPEPPRDLRPVPFYAQTLDFTCGPAALLMAMKAHRSDQPFSRTEELRLWRESTTIFMTAGHGGCGPEGLALAASRRGYGAEVYVNTAGPMFIDSVRSEDKKEVMRVVHEDFTEAIAGRHVPRLQRSLTGADLQVLLEAGAIPLVLISLYRIHGERTPHWVVITGLDERFIYLNDPFVDEASGMNVTDCVNLPIARGDFDRMARYGRTGQRAVVAVYAAQRDEPALP